MNPDFVAADLPKLILRRARLFARVHRPQQLIDAESYHADLSVARFEILWAGEPASVARFQQIASYVPESSSWLWGFENRTIPNAATEEMKDAMARLPQLATLLAHPTWQMDMDSAYDLADWIAFRTGYEAMYPAVFGERATRSFLALTFVEHHGRPSAGPAAWCIGCGELGWRLRGPVINGPEGRSLCSGCARNPIEILEIREAEEPGLLTRDPGDEPDDAPMADYVCAFCERRRPRVLMPETALCWWCIDLIREVLEDAADRGPGLP